MTKTFEELDLAEPLKKAVADLGFVTPTPIQAAALPLLLDGKDVAGQAQTGTGKTACFLLATMNRILTNPRPKDGRPSALVIAPTRELAMQIASDAVSLSTYTDLRVVVCCGGVSWTKQQKQLDDGADIVVGTPGRLLDYIRKGVLRLNVAKTLVVDEADRMFDMGFIRDLQQIFRALPRKEKRQSLLFSATLSEAVLRLAWRHMNDPETVIVTPDTLVVDQIAQSLYHVARYEKANLLMGLMNREQPQRSIVFVNRKRDGEELTWRLNQNGYEAVYLSGDLAQKTRTRIIDALKDGKVQTLVATDVASRGIHVDDISHVFNYDVPQDPEDYVHRIGRTARAGNKGTAMTLACEETVTALPNLEKMLGDKIPVAYAEDEDFVPDRAGRFPRSKKVYTGWPPASMKGEVPADEGSESSVDGPPKKKRRRRRRGGGGGGGGGGQRS